MTKYQHPDATHTEDVRDDFAEMYESQGWTAVKAPKSEEKPDPKK
ncbi:hypothetical protein [Nocardioides sp. URHA0032]|nr:hypothetical protein [Nocardioides sp. URHA0032]